MRSRYTRIKTDLSLINRIDPNASVNLPAIVRTSDASTLTNCPVASGGFYATWDVEFELVGTSANPESCRAIVICHEIWPTPGRIWCRAYNFGWKDWIHINPTKITPITNIQMNSTYCSGGQISCFKKDDIVFFNARDISITPDNNFSKSANGNPAWIFKNVPAPASGQANMFFMFFGVQPAGTTWQGYRLVVGADGYARPHYTLSSGTAQQTAGSLIYVTAS